MVNKETQLFLSNQLNYLNTIELCDLNMKNGWG